MSVHVYLPGATRHVATSDVEVPRTATELGSVDGRRVAILDNGWDAMGPLVDHLSRRLTELGAVEVMRVPAFAGRPLPDATLDEVAREVDYSISALGN